MPTRSPSEADELAAVAAAAELRTVVTRLSRGLRAANAFPSGGHAVVLGHLLDGGPQTAAWLASAERITPQSMAQTVHDLAEAGLVTRTPDATDRRRVIVALTDRGREILQQDRRHREQWFRETVAATYSPPEQALLVRAMPLLMRLASA